LTCVEENGWITDHRKVNGRVAAMFDGKVNAGTIDRIFPAYIDSEGQKLGTYNINQDTTVYLQVRSITNSNRYVQAWTYWSHCPNQHYQIINEPEVSQSTKQQQNNTSRW
jgi:cation transport regulator ChaC